MYPKPSKELLNKRIAVIRGWPEDRKQKVYADIKAINKLFKETNVSSTKCSAFVCQVSEAALDFEGGLGDEDAKFILWG